MIKEFLITDYGAAAGSEELCTAAIQKAIDECFLQGGGRVVVPAGRFRTGGLRLRTGVTLYLKSGACIQGSRDPADYYGYLNDTLEPLSPDEITDQLHLHVVAASRLPDYRDNDAEIYRWRRVAGSPWHNALIRAIRAENIAIIGEEGSEFDGDNCYDENGEEHYRGPHGVHFVDCSGVTLRGYTFRNSSNWAHKFLRCKNLYCENITVLAGHDGVHYDECENAVVQNCTFHTGDDCVAAVAVTNLMVRDCVLNTACNAVRLGGTNAVIRGCKIYGPGEYLFRGSLTPEEKKNGVPSLCDPTDTTHEYYLRSVFDYYGDYGVHIEEQPCNILFTDCEIENAWRLMIYQYGTYCQGNRPLDSVTFRNLKVTGLRIPLIAYGDAECPLTLSLENIDISVAPEFEHDAPIYIADFKELRLENVTVTGKQFAAAVDAATDGDTAFHSVSIEGVPENTVRRSAEKTPFGLC